MDVSITKRLYDDRGYCDIRRQCLRGWSYRQCPVYPFAGPSKNAPGSRYWLVLTGGMANLRCRGTRIIPPEKLKKPLSASSVESGPLGTTNDPIAESSEFFWQQIAGCR